MCHALYAASDGDLPLVPAGDPPVFSVQEAEHAAERLAQHLPGLPCLRYLGAHTGCSCGFHDEDGGASRAALVDYLHALPVGQRVGLYDCWEGDWPLAALDSRDATCSDLLLPAVFAERRRITIVRETMS